MFGSVKALRNVILVFSTFFISCDLINPAEDIPAYIQIDTVLVTVSDLDKGSASHSLNNIYLSVGGENLGVFEMPFSIPCLQTGLQTLTIRPGVKLNGIAASRYAYPFFQSYLSDVELHAGEISKITPTTTYKSDCVFAWMEDFEDAGVSFSFPETTTVRLINQNIEVKEGRYSGIIELKSDQLYFEGTSRDEFNLPPSGSPLLLEFDYKNTNPFEIGMYIIADQTAVWSTVMIIYPSSTWKRIYIDLGTYVNYETTAEMYKPGIRAEYVESDSLSTYVYLDNLKLIHF